ncbi:hypothetical protein Tco_0865357 [Tanacetum coccineum]
METFDTISQHAKDQGQAPRTGINNVEASGVGVSQPGAYVGVVLGESSVGGKPSVGAGIARGSSSLVSSSSRWN